MGKKRHPIRNTFIALISIVALALGGVAITICDFTDNTPEYISEVEGMEPGDYLGEKAKESLKESTPLSDYKYVFSEHELNDLFATIVPKIDIPAINLKSMYISINEDDSFAMEAPFYALFYRSCAKGFGELIGAEDSITMKISELKVNLLSSKDGIVKSLLSEERIEAIEDAIREQGIEIDLWKEEADIYAKMTLEDICKTIVNNCSDPRLSFLVSAVGRGLITTHTASIVVNENDETGIIIHRGLL